MTTKTRTAEPVLGRLTAADLDGDYEPGRAEATMTEAHRAALEAMVRRLKRKE